MVSALGIYTFGKTSDTYLLS